MKRNKFKRALHHLNKKHVVESAPTNNTTGVFSVTPSGVGPVGWTDRTFTTDISGNPLPKDEVADFTVGENPENSTEAKDTSGLFEADGVTVKTLTPPGDNSYILGPFASMWYAWGNFTTLGYIEEGTRKMRNLGTITGKLSDWDGSSINSYGQLTLEQALWFRDVKKFGDIDNDPANHNYRAFYPGPPSNVPDAFGRYRCVIAASREAGGEETRPGAPDNPTQKGGMSADDNFSLSHKIKDLLDKMGKNWQDNTEGMGDKLKDNLKKVLEQGKNFVDDLFDANNAADFNAKLAVSLGLSILSGKKIDIPLSDSAKKDLINNIDANALKDVLKINNSTPTTADEAINPSGNKSDKVLGGGWDAQGGVDFNFNQKTGELEIVSNKTLRTDSGGETIKKDKRAPNFEVDKLTDIPDADKKSVQDMSTKIISDISKKLGGPGLDPNLPNFDIQQQLDSISQKYDDNKITSAVTDWASDFISQTTQGTAQNILAIRKALKNLSIKTTVDTNAWKPFSKDSDIEKIGGAAGHVTSTTKVKLDELPPDVQKVIKDKLSVKESLKFSKKNLLREIVIPEAKKKYKVKPKVIGHPSNKTLSNQMKDTTPTPAFKKEIPVWSMDQKMRNARSSQAKKNEVLEYLGSSGDHWDYMTKTIKEHNKKIINLNYGGKKKKVTRKEQVDKDILVFMEDDLGNKSSVLQSKINEMQAEAGDKEMFAKYYEMNPQKKSLFKEVVKRGVFDYKGKPSKKGYPDKEPAQLDPKTGMHPGYGKKYKHDKLDPHSAESMPMQGDPEIDANISKNVDPEKKKRKSRILSQPNG